MMLVEEGGQRGCVVARAFGDDGDCMRLAALVRGPELMGNDFWRGLVMPPTERTLNGLNWPPISPLYPCRTPKTSQP